MSSNRNRYAFGDTASRPWPSLRTPPPVREVVPTYPIPANAFGTWVVTPHGPSRFATPSVVKDANAKMIINCFDGILDFERHTGFCNGPYTVTLNGQTLFSREWPTTIIRRLQNV